MPATHPDLGHHQYLVAGYVYCRCPAGRPSTARSVGARTHLLQCPLLLHCAVFPYRHQRIFAIGMCRHFVQQRAAITSIATVAQQGQATTLALLALIGDRSL